VKKIIVRLKENTYPILIGKNSLSSLIDKLNSQEIFKCLILIDKNVEKYHSQYLRKIFAGLNCKSYKYIFNATELNKNLNQSYKIFKFLSSNYFNRNSSILAVGGGITGDIAGFTASTFMRGISYYQVPTTLLSMVDSSVGGKTGVNFDNRKNFIGTFYQPNGVYINSMFLDSLPQREVISGIGEIFKYSFLADYKNYSLLKKNLESIINRKKNNYNPIIESCLKIKSNIVSQDEKEIIGLRKILNLGHTFAHAFEVQSSYKLKHGEAVIGGVFCSLFLSEELRYISTEQLKDFINDYKFITLNKLLINLDEEKIYQSMMSDKKNSSGKIKLVLLEDIGKIVIDILADKLLIINSIKRMRKLV